MSLSYLLDLGSEELKKILGATRNCGSWSKIEAPTFTKNTFEAVILKKMLSISVFEFMKDESES